MEYFLSRVAEENARYGNADAGAKHKVMTGRAICFLLQVIECEGPKEHSVGFGRQQKRKLSFLFACFCCEIGDNGAQANEDDAIDDDGY